MEAQSIRASADALPSTSNVIVAGDLNVYRSDESMYGHLLGTGNAQLVDPINAPGSWTQNEEFLPIHTQSPWDSAIAPGFGGSAGGMDDRLDHQVVSTDLIGGVSGLAYIPDSYHAFGNNGSHGINTPINTGSGQSPTVLAALASILDHLPVVADYQLRPRLGIAHPGDADSDYTTDVDDFAIVAARFNQQANWFTGDFDASGVTDVDDFSILAVSFNIAAASTTGAIVLPEPRALVVWCFAARYPVGGRHRARRG